MNFAKGFIAAALALSAATAVAQPKEIRIAHVYDKTGPLEAYAIAEWRLDDAMAVLVQYLSAKLGLVTGMSLPEAVGSRMRRRSRLAGGTGPGGGSRGIPPRRPVAPRRVSGSAGRGCPRTGSPPSPRPAPSPAAQRHDHGARPWVTISEAMDRTTSSIQPVPQLLGCAEPVALGHQLGDLVPVGVVVEHHADDGGRPWRLVERRPGVGQGQQLVAG